jgi:catechol 2,3-dioxygenase-like lactoylglutathione lyase family enzyme
VKPTAVHHVAICVRELDAAVRFYTEVLGFTVMPQRPAAFGPGAWLESGTAQVHLMVADEHPPGLQHFALRVDDLDAAVAAIAAKGVRVDPAPHTPGAGRQAFLRDPAGNLIELNQPD